MTTSEMSVLVVGDKEFEIVDATARAENAAINFTIAVDANGNATLQRNDLVNTEEVEV